MKKFAFKSLFLSIFLAIFLSTGAFAWAGSGWNTAPSFGGDADQVTIDDAGNIITATEVEGALQENRTAIDLNTTNGAAYHGGMYFNTNTTDTIISTVSKEVGLTDFVEGPGITGFTFEAGEVGTFTAIADSGGTHIVITTGAHSVDVGDWVVINQTTANGTEDIDGRYVVTADGGTTFTVAYAGHDGTNNDGFWQSPSQLALSATGLTNAEFGLEYSFSVARQANNGATDVDWLLYINDTEQVQAHIRRSLTNTPSADGYGVTAAGGRILMDTDDVLYLVVVAEDQTDNLLHKYGSLRITRSE